MAKRKKNKNPKPDNVIQFPSAEKRNKKSPNTFPKKGDFQAIDRENKLFYDIIRDEVEKRNITTQEEINLLMQEFVGRTLPDIISEYSDNEEEEEMSDHDYALYLLDMIDEDASNQTIRKYAKEAIEICETCYEAWITLALTYQYKKGIETFQKAVEIGKKQFAPYFPKKGEKGHMWYHHTARSFLHMYHTMGMFQREFQKDHDAIETFNTLIQWTSDDNLSAREILYGLHFKVNNPEAVRSLLAQFSEDDLLTSKIAETTLVYLDEYETLSTEDKNTIQASVKADSPIDKKLLPKTIASFKKLHKRNGYCIMTISNPAIYDLPPCPSYTHGSVAEAVHASYLMAYTWASLSVPYHIAFNAKFPLPKKHTDEDIEILNELRFALKSLLEDHNLHL